MMEGKDDIGVKPGKVKVKVAVRQRQVQQT